MKQLKLAAEYYGKEKEDYPLRHQPKMENNALESSNGPRNTEISVEPCRPQIDEAPVFYPTIEEFEDTLSYIAKIRPLAESHGICRIVPPASWVPPCPLKEKQLWENTKFPTRIQQINLLQNREPVTGKKRRGRKRKYGKLSKMGTFTTTHDNSHSEEATTVVYEPADKFGFQSGPEFTFKEFQQHADTFKDHYFRARLNDANENLNGFDNNNQQERSEPTVGDIEGEYWRIVEKTTDELEVYYGADLETGAIGSGFPKTSSLDSESDIYAMSGWNLNNFARLPGSALCFEGSDIPGVLVPWLYVGMCFSTFCWHVEDHNLYSLNYLHWGDPKVWYGVPGSHASALEDAMRKHLPHLFEQQPNLLNELVTQFSPTVLKSEGVPVFRTVQHSGEFVITFPRAYHCGFSCGFNCAEAVNVAPFDWFVQGQNAVELYSVQCRKTSLSHDKLLFGSAQEAIHALAKITLHGEENKKYLKWRDACGKDGVLTKAVKTRITMENERLEWLPTHLKMKKMDNDFDLFEERECLSCLYDLHLSAVGCECSPDSYSCLRHFKLLCSCEMDKRFVLFRYTTNELRALVEALEGEPHAIQGWENRNIGVVSANVEDSCMHEQDMCKTNNYDEGKISASCAGNNEKSNSNVNSSPHSNISSELVHLESHHETSNTPYGATISHMKDKKLVMDNEVKEDQGGFVNKNIGVISDDPKNSVLNIAVSHHNKSVPYVGKVCCVDARKEPGVDGNSVLEQKMSLRSTHVRNYCTPDRHTLVGADVRVHSDSGPELNNAFQMRVLETPNINMSLIQQSILIQKFGNSVESVSLGSPLYGKLWCSKHAIYPKGFKSRVKFFSFLEPASTCNYICEVIDGGLLGPLFRVTLEEHINEAFVDTSADKCWVTVLDRLKHEIKRRKSLGEQSLPHLELLQSINGHKMFGFHSPSIIQSIEDKDLSHRCIEYWNHKEAISRSSGRAMDASKFTDASSSKSQGDSNTKLFGVNLIKQEEDNIEDSFEEMKPTLEGFLKKAGPDELRAMHKLFSSDAQLTQWRVAFKTLIEKSKKFVHEQA